MSRNSYQGLAWIAAMAFFMQTLDATILNTALPAISLSLNESPLDMQLSIIGYSISVALFIPLSGWLSDRYGSLTIFRFALFAFVLGSIFCALSNSLNQLVISRILQGIGGALMMPVVRLVIIRSVPKNQLLNAWNLMAMAGLVGPILGPILGGWLVTYFSWHWIFLINIPIGLFGIVISGLYMPNLKNITGKLDWKGFVLFSIALVGFTLGLDLIAESFISVGLAMNILFLGTLFFLFYYWHAKVFPSALLPLSLFDIRTFRLGLLANLFIRLCASSIPFLLPLMFQVVFQYRADEVGWLLAPIPISAILMKFAVTYILKRFGYKKTLILFSFAMAINIASMGLLTSYTPVWKIVILFGCYGACMSVIFTAINTLTVSKITDELASAGSTVLSVAQQIGLGIGIATSSLVLSFYRQTIGENLLQLQYAFSYTFFTISLFTVIVIFILYHLRSTDGNELR
ncbi:EmrB/QacA subfamily drug resistance transporter [Bisgaardia hudsonensis]|uniref:EmrB/QacA subfamily drug resistance transporter n=1 Tax=Bisgaardia hudsonensis TaxID=109472 RepID=A0A4R2MUD0_9PAST|nr:MFS transporter [Bisgaardia hudsonensis]QLB12239.1 MFS transporter [Bisgaardia hudsonensis]TCP12282.1 EmrB/QacA subfamily drug resistance transporter [Bisgaardia hudsonensis]